METSSELLDLCAGIELYVQFYGAGNSSATVEFPAQKPVTRSFAVFFDLCLNKRLCKQ